MGERGKFFKRSHDRNVEVNDDKALASECRLSNYLLLGIVVLPVPTQCFSSTEITADIRRRMENHRKWASPFEKQAAKPKITSHPPSLNSAPEVKTTSKKHPGLKRANWKSHDDIQLFSFDDTAHSADRKSC